MLRSLLTVFLCWLLLPGSLIAAYEWRSFADDKDQIALWQDGRQLGNYRFSTREYLPRLAHGVWGKPCEPPYPPPCRCCERCRCEGNCKCPQGKPCCDGCRCIYPAKVEPDGTLNFGLDLDRIPPVREHILNGKEVSKEELLKAIGKPQLPDDSKWLCLTIIGPEAARQRVLADLQSSPALAPWKGKIKVQDYPPDHWAVKDTGFVTTGNPTIYCQAPDGKVLHRQDDYRGPEALAEVLRKADPAYKPEKDPDLNKSLTNVPLVVWIAGAILLILLLSKGGGRLFYGKRIHHGSLVRNHYALQVRFLSMKRIRRQTASGMESGVMYRLFSMDKICRQHRMVTHGALSHRGDACVGWMPVFGATRASRIGTTQETAQPFRRFSALQRASPRLARFRRRRGAERRNGSASGTKPWRIRRCDRRPLSCP